MRTLHGIALLVLFCSAHGATSKRQNVTDERVNVASNDGKKGAFIKFPLEVGKRIEADTDGNKIISTLSVTVMLSVLYLAAAGDTAKQIENALNLPPNAEKVIDVLTTLRNAVERPNRDFNLENYPLKTETKVILKESLAPPPENEIAKTFAEFVAEHLFAKIEVTPQFDDTVRSKVNQWASEFTKGTIKNLILPGELNENQAALLVNAVLLQAKWLHPFDPSRSKKYDFFVVKDKQNQTFKRIQVDGMSAENLPCRYVWLEKLKSHALELRLSDSLSRVLILLPGDLSANLDDLENAVDAKLFTDIHSKLMERQDVDVQIPVVNIETKASMRMLLEKMGIRKVFERDSAELPGLTGKLLDHSIHVSDFKHQANLKWNETGVLASGGSVGDIAFTWNLSPVINVDRPFLLYVNSFASSNSRQPNLILFTGRISLPVVSYEE
ncbi:unnamed protein product [Notodromas monacha]|uniref:Serpin domain-containing protein n=1 Tax=Notodromas monacha TaxID=399045 RepID=A0A7R9GDA1_9CRUS|nr:unnamed protein product [Notodromas monacha]CAG0916714.1 unnamed protein product [Notodromas monacha]